MKNIIFAGVLCIIATGLSAQSSTFDSDADGWTFLGPSNTLLPITYQNSNGNPGGYASVTYSSNVNISRQNWIAPPQFYGNKLALSLGMAFRFDMQQSIAGTATSGNGDVRIEGGGNAIVYSLPAKPAIAPAWSSYSIILDESAGWRYNASGGALATRTQIMAVLRNITEIEIRGTYGTNGLYTSGIDNVTLEQRVLPVAPAISSFSPLSAEPGSSLTINGTDFDAAAENNAVYFGSVAGVVTSASASQLNVTVPVAAMYSRITVVNKTKGLVSRSDKPFNPVFKGGGRLIPASFDAKFDIPIGFNPKGATIGDIDGDGWIDIGVASNSAKTVDIYRNLGLGGDLTVASFAPKYSLAVTGAGTNGTGLALYDLDGDGKLDVVTSAATSPFAAAFVTFRNISTPGNLAFEAQENWGGGSDETPIALIEDLDGDGRAELMGGEGAQCGCVRTDFWANQNISTPGDIEFGAPLGFYNNSVISGFAGVIAGDLDGDGKKDLAVSGGFGQSLTILKNTSIAGLPSFTNSFTIATGQYNRSLKIVDINLDGKNDLIWKKSTGIYIRINSDTNGILEAADFTTEIILTGDTGTDGGITISDLNGDNKPDLVVSDNLDIGFFENTFAGGTFKETDFIKSYQVPGDPGVATYPYGPLVADFNGDSRPDVALVTTNTSFKISIFENKNIHTPAISLHTVSPLAGPVGSTVTITGDYFSTIPSENKVWFGGIEATVLSSTKNTITAEVPAGAGYERVSVTRNTLTSYYHLPFTTTFGPGTTFDNTSFAPPVTYPLTGVQYDVEVADMNNDGKPEMFGVSRIVTGIIRNYGIAYRNIHSGTSITMGSFLLDDTTSTSATNLNIMDVDSDGRPDVLSIEGAYRNSSTTGGELDFDNDISSAVSTGRSVADFNADGKVDVVGLTNGGGTISLFENRSPRPGAFITGTFSTFSAAVILAKPAAGGSVAAADFDNDGLPDFAATNPGADNFTVWRNNGGYRITAALFTAVGNTPAGDNPGRIYTADLDLDGKMDLLTYHNAGTDATKISVFHNQSTAGNIAFTKVDFTIANAATVAHIRDLDGDGKPELIVTGEAASRIFILKNTSTPGTINATSFAAPAIYTVTNPRGLTTGDLNLDGKPEIIVGSAPNSLLIFENIVPSGPTITITAQPAFTYACEGSSATFSTDAAGTTNLSYRWQKYDGTTFVDLNEGSGYSGTAAKTLSINTAITGLAGNGEYRAKVSGDLTPNVFTDEAQLTINSLPEAPDVTGETKCVSPSTLTLTASGASDGDYNWYDVQTDGLVLGTNGSFTTPSIAATKTFYVTIEDTFCESERIAVEATISLLAKPTLNASETITAGHVDICEGENVTLIAPTGFTIYTWSNGASTREINIDQTGNYSVVVGNAGCVSPSSDPVIVAVNPFPNADIEANGTTLTATAGGSYQWYRNNQIISGATSQAFEFNVVEYGAYTVDVTENGCTTTSEDFIYLITAVPEITSGANVYPNPVTNELVVESSGPGILKMFDAVGKEVGQTAIQNGSNAIATTGLSTGFYTLVIQSGGKTRVVKIHKVN